MSNTKPASILKDLSRKFPTGPYGKLRPTDYLLKLQYVSEYDRDMQWASLQPRMVGQLGITEENIEYCGYDLMQLFEMFTVKGKYSSIDTESVTALVKQHLPLRGQGLTRTVRKIKARMRGLSEKIRKAGAVGVWSVTSWGESYGGLWRDFPIWGTSRSDVESKVRLIGPMTGLKPDCRLDITFERLGTQEDAAKMAHARATRVQQKLTKDIESYEQHLARMKNDLDKVNEDLVPVIGALMLLTADASDEGASEQEAAQ